jgi:hypothetical protein
VKLRLVWAQAVLAAACFAQGGAWSYRGFLDDSLVYYPSTTANDQVQLVNETLLRVEGKLQLAGGFGLSAGLDARTDSDSQVIRAWRFSWDDRTAQRPPFALRTMSLHYTHGAFRVEAGKQVLHWGQMDFSSPTDKLAPRDYINPASADTLGAFAVRAVADTGPRSLEVVYLPHFTPSRIPLLDRRWLILPSEFDGYSYHSQSVRYPGGGQYGVRYHQIVSPYEFSVCYFEGFKTLPTFLYDKDPVNRNLNYQTIYPKMRMVGVDFAAPWRGLLWKAESAYIDAASPHVTSAWTYAIQAEKTADKWQWAVEFAGDKLTQAKRPNTLDLDRATRDAVSGHVAWTPNPRQTVSAEWFVHPNGQAFVTRILYSRNLYSTLRASGGLLWIGGSQSDPLARYNVNSYMTLQLRYSF